MTVVFQCLLHIPALSRSLLKTDIIHDLSENTFLFQYTQLLKLLIHKGILYEQSLSTKLSYFKDRRLLLVEKNFNNKNQDTHELFVGLLENFTYEYSSNFEYIEHHHFCIKLEKGTTIPDCGKYSINRGTDHFLYLELVPEIPKTRIKSK